MSMPDAEAETSWFDRPIPTFREIGGGISGALERLLASAAGGQAASPYNPYGIELASPEAVAKNGQSHAVELARQQAAEQADKHPESTVPASPGEVPFADFGMPPKPLGPGEGVLLRPGDKRPAIESSSMPTYISGGVAPGPESGGEVTSPSGSIMVGRPGGKMIDYTGEDGRSEVRKTFAGIRNRQRETQFDAPGSRFVGPQEPQMPAIARASSEPMEPSSEAYLGTVPSGSTAMDRVAMMRMRQMEAESAAAELAARDPLAKERLAVEGRLREAEVGPAAQGRAHSALLNQQDAIARASIAEQQAHLQSETARIRARYADQMRRLDLSPLGQDKKSKEYLAAAAEAESGRDAALADLAMQAGIAAPKADLYRYERGGMR